MFSNTAFEAMYQYLGLELHGKFISVITSQKVFLAAIAIIFGAMFFITAAQFFSRYIPGVLLHRRMVPLSRFIRIIFFLFIGISFLKVGSSTSIHRYNGDAWAQNPYIKAKIKNIQPEYKVSLAFDLLSRTAEEIAALINRVIDSVFLSKHSQLEAPDFFFKAIMYGASATLDDPYLKKSIQFYTEECFDKLLPIIKLQAKENKLDGFFADNAIFDKKLSDIPIETPDKTPYTCLDVKNETRSALKTYAIMKAGGINKNLDQYLKNNGNLNVVSFENLQISSFLVNQYSSEHEGFLGIQKGSQLPSTAGRIFQYMNRLFSFEGITSLFGYQGAAVTASRSQEFSENLARAPHVAGFIKMILIAGFPWLLFFVVAGYWRVLYYWFLIYFSVLLWAPIWTLLYHVMVGISLSSQVMEAFGRLNDGISMYSAQLISSRIFHLYAVYSWLQLLIGTLFTGMLLYFLKPALSDTEADSQPEAIDNVGRVSGAASKAAGVFV